MKGAILSANPNAHIVDITHDIPAHDIHEAAFTLLSAYSTFPGGTIHVAVVDPGVGSSRRPILIESDTDYFIGPDNGIFSYVMDRSRNFRVFHLTNDKYFRTPVSQTFNGRDLFAPVAGALSNGVKPTELGKQVDEYVRLESLDARRARDGTIRGRIIHIDHFGNCVTNITKDQLTEKAISKGASVRVKGVRITTFKNYFAEDTEGRRAKIFGVWGSAGFLEISAVGQSAAKIARLKRGDEVVLTNSGS
jgi:S-adenosyl-L-methionine hydrolase (adenosine-forming)